jgi:hypothetical protein
MIERLSEERLEKIRQLIMHPRPGSKVAAAKEFGIDLTLTFGQLKKTPHERLEDLQSAMKGLEEFARAGAEMRKRRNNGRI